MDYSLISTPTPPRSPDPFVQQEVVTFPSIEHDIFDLASFTMDELDPNGLPSVLDLCNRAIELPNFESSIDI